MIFAPSALGSGTSKSSAPGSANYNLPCLRGSARGICRSIVGMGTPAPSIVLFRALTICSTGLYWQISPAPSGAILRSRSLDGEMLTLPTDIPRRGQMQVHHLSGPQGSSPHCAASRKERTSNGKF